MTTAYRQFGALLAVFAATVAVAQDAPRLEGWTYRFDNRYLGPDYADKTGKMLSDGKQDGLVIFAGGTVTIDIELGAVTRVAGLRVYVTRPNLNYNLKDLTVQGRVMGQYQTLGVVPGFWANAGERKVTLELKDLKTTTDALRLVFNAPWALSLAEIGIYGEPVTLQAAAAPTVPLLNDAKPSAREADVDGDGKPEVILENSLVRLVFWPAAGGVCRSFLYKPTNTEFVSPTGAGYGFLRDQLWAPAYQFAERPYNPRLGGDANQAWVELSTTGLGGMMGFTHVTKRISLDRASPEVQVVTKLQNDPSSQTDYIYGLWSHNFVGAAGQTNRYFYPTAQGVQEFSFDPARPPKSADAWFYEPARGWSAVCGEQGTSLAVSLDLPYLHCFYNWGGVGVTVPTYEWRYSRVPLKSGEAFETKSVFTPFTGFARVDGVIGDVVGAVELTPGPASPQAATVRLAVLSPDGKPVSAAVRLRKLPDGPWQDKGTATAAPGKAAELAVPLAGLEPGGYVLNCQVSREGKVLDDFERPFTAGQASLAYQRPPNQKRRGLGPEEGPALPRHDLVDTVRTPHVPWATPLAGGPIKALILCDDANAREIIELKQRLDLNFDYVKFRTFNWEEEIYQGDRSISNPDQANARLLDCLKKNKYELILLAGFDWEKHFKEAVRTALTEQVRAGAGLIFIEPDGFKESDPLAPLMGTGGKRSYWEFAKWQAPQTSPLTAGLAWDLFPQSRFMAYAQPPQGEVLATLSNGKPLLVTNEFGQGRTAVLTYDTLTHDWPYRGYSGLTPILSMRGGFLRDEYKQMSWNYWEGWYALLCRLSVWAAKRDSGVTVTALQTPEKTAFGQAGELTVKLAGGQGQYTVEVTAENRCRQPLPAQKLTWTAGQGDLRVPLPAYLPAGPNLVSLVVRDPGGNSVAWAQAHVKGTAAVTIKSLKTEKEIVQTKSLAQAGQPWERVFAPVEPLVAKVALDTVTPLPAGLALRARLTDTHGRLLTAETQTLAEGMSEATFTANPPELRANGLQWEVAVVSPQGTLDIAQTRLLCPAPREWKHFRMTSWGGIFPWRSEYLYQYLAPRVEDLVDIAFHGSTELNTGHVWTNYWYDLDWSYLGLLGYMGQGVADFMDGDYAKKVAQYNQTRDKQYLVRNPCLEDQEWRGKMAEHVRKVAGQAAKFGGVYDFCMGDEMSLTYYTAYFDFDWDPRSLAAFRTWLKGRYPDLNALNQAWEANYATWDEVLPLTLEEARQRPNAAPWGEFRDFMNDSLAGVYRQVSDTLKTVDPQARAGLSGTQEPRAGNGMDWWKNSQAFNFYHAYNTGWSNEMRRSFAPYTGVAQSPYYAGYWQSGGTIEYNVFWCLLHDTNALSAWHTPLFFYNDFTYSECGRDTLKLCQEMKAGIWDVLREARRQHDGIAIHYSHDSINAAQLMAREEQQKDMRDAWVKLVEDMGLQYDFVATPQIETGILSKGDAFGRKYRLLILPQSLAISDRERDEITAFVKAGGVVIADSYAGIMDGKCRKGSQGQLDSLFGLKRTDGRTAPTPAVPVQLPGGATVEVKLPTVEALALAGATAWGASGGEAKVPALLRQQVGKGLAWYLNLDLRPHDAERAFHSAPEQALRQVMGAVFAQSGVNPRFPVKLDSGHPSHVEVVRYQSGDLLYLGLLQPRGEPEELATVSLGKKWHVYDCRRHLYRGQVDRLREALRPGQGVVYLLSAKPLVAPKLAVATPQVKRGTAVKYTVSVPGALDAARQGLRVEVLRPDGTVYGDYSRNLLLGAKPHAAAFRLALNDPAGAWKLRVRDLASGATVTAGFTVN